MKPTDGKEKELQGQITAVLSGMGYTCLQAGLYRASAKCPRCAEEFYPDGGNGSSPGIADLLVSRRAWGRPVWAGLEVKRRTRSGRLTRVRLVQRILADAGQNVIVASIAEAVDAMQAVETALGFSHPLVERFWDNNPRRLFE